MEQIQEADCEQRLKGGDEEAPAATPFNASSQEADCEQSGHFAEGESCARSPHSGGGAFNAKWSRRLEGGDEYNKSKIRSYIIPFGNIQPVLAAVSAEYSLSGKLYINLLKNRTAFNTF